MIATPLPDTTTTSAPARTIAFPGNDDGDDAVREIIERGNLPLLIGDKILAEVPSNELNEGLVAAGDLSNSELSRISSGLVESLREALMSGCAACDVGEVAADAAALFVLCLRRNNMLDTGNLPACSVNLSDGGGDASLKLTA